jgi:nicotinamide-nucleotide amidase
MTETLSPALPKDVEDLVAHVLKRACERQLKLVTAESCTGGLLASLLTDVEGFGRAFERGFVHYTDEAKSQTLDVPPDLLRRFTAVSAQVAEAMALGALAQSQGDVAVSITGFAGRGAPGEEPGLVLRRPAPGRDGAAPRGPFRRYRSRAGADRLSPPGAEDVARGYGLDGPAAHTP